MSYTKRYNTQIAVNYSGSVSYPPSQNGGSTYYSGTAYENVTIDITVDTDDFDREVNQCGHTVNSLTSSIVATKAAHINSIQQNAKRIGSTIVKGFFDTVRSEVSQQIMELSTKVDATLLHLKGLAEQCKKKHEQMQTDYGRLLSRYSKVFNDLNNELENRIFELSRPVFMFKRKADERVLQAACGDIASTATVSHAEQSVLEARIASSIAKNRAAKTILQANNFLTKQKRTDRILTQSSIDQALSASIYLPVCYLETADQNITNRQAYTPEMLKSVNSQHLAEQINQTGIENELAGDTSMLENYFNNEVCNVLDSTNEHDKRVMGYISKLFYSNIKQ